MLKRADAAGQLERVRSGDIGGFGGSGRAFGAHGDSQIGRSQRRRVIDAVADHHDRAILSLGQYNQGFLVRA